MAAVGRFSPGIDDAFLRRPLRLAGFVVALVCAAYPAVRLGRFDDGVHSDPLDVADGVRPVLVTFDQFPAPGLGAQSAVSSVVAGAMS